jgi:hypothetical protein
MGPLAYFRLPWYQTPTWLAGLLAICLLIFLSVWGRLGVNLLRRQPTPPAGWLAAGFGLLLMGLLLGLAPVFLALADRFAYHAGTVRLIGTLAWLAVPAALLLSVAVGNAWRLGSGSQATRLHDSLAALAALASLWLLETLHLFAGLG